MLTATRYRLYPTPGQAQALAFQLGAVRWAYNDALTLRSTAWRERGERIGLRETLDRLVPLKRAPATAWLQQADSQALQQAVMHLDHAFQRFFRKQGRYPRFKSRHGRQALSYPQRVNVVDGRALYLPKVGEVKAVLHRPVCGRIKTVTVSKTRSGAYYASVLCDDGRPLPAKPECIAEEAITGVDLGLTALAVENNGKKTPNPRILTRARARLRRRQQALSRKQKGSANRAKARLRLARAHEKVAAVREDFQHKLSKRLVDENQATCVETLKTKNLMRNRRLAKHIGDAAWGSLVAKLDYKAARAGRHLVKIDPWYPSSKTCSACGHVRDKLDLEDRKWDCAACGTHHDRDVNAAVNIRQQGILALKAAGLSVSACGGLRQSGNVLLPAAA